MSENNSESKPFLTETSAAVSPPESRRMYKGEASVMVEPASQPAMQREGWLFNSVADLPQLVDEIKAAVGAFASNVAKAVDAAASESGIDTDVDGDLKGASAALSDAERYWHELLVVLHSAYPVKATGKTVTLKHPQGHDVEVAEEQAESYKHAFSKGISTPIFVTVEHPSDTEQTDLHTTMSGGELRQVAMMRPLRKVISEHELDSYVAEGWKKV